MSASFFRGHFLRLTTSQLRFKHTYRSISIPYRSFSASPTPCDQGSNNGKGSFYSAFWSLIGTKESKIRRRSQELTTDGQSSGPPGHTQGPVVEKALSRLFRENYDKMIAEDPPSAPERKERLLCLIHLARSETEWLGLGNLFRMLKKNNWAIEPVAERALFVKAVEHAQIQVPIGLLEDHVIQIPSLRVARSVFHVLISPPGGTPTHFLERLRQCLRFIKVSVAPEDDPVVGSLVLLGLLQAAGEMSFDVGLRKRFAYEALMLGITLKKKYARLDGSGGDAISLTVEEKGWMYVAMAGCFAQLQSSVVLERLKAAWLDPPVDAQTGKAANLGPQADKDWGPHLKSMKNWISNAAATIAASGGSCSGKTTLAKALQSILPDCILLHQDDFGPPPERIPNHPIHNVPDWEDPETAIEWPKLIKCLQDMKKQGALTTHVKHDGWGGGADGVHLSSTTLSGWKQVFESLTGELAAKGVKITWAIVEGFVLYWHPEVVSELDVRLFLRGQHDSMKARREIRGEYQALDGYTWNDPPNYWDNVVWPAYLKAHRHLFMNGDINGTATKRNSDTEFVAPNDKGDKNPRHSTTDLVVLPAERATLEELVEIACLELKAFQTALIERAADW